MPRRPHPRLAQRASRLPAVVLAAAAAGAVYARAHHTASAAEAPGAPLGAGRGARPSFVDAAVRRLRAAVVGDVAVDRAADAADDAGAGATPGARAARDRRALAERVRRGAPAAPRGDVTAGVPWWADSAHWGPEVIRRRDVQLPAVEVAAGDTLAVPAPALPALLPAALRRRGVYWTAEGGVRLVPAAADDARDDARDDSRDDGPPDAARDAEWRAGARRVVAAAPGAGAVVATTAVGRTVLPVRVRAAVRGRVYAADEGAAGRAGPPRARVVVTRAGAAPDTTWTDAAGRFRLALPAGWDGAASVRVEAAGADAGAYAPAALGPVEAARLHTLGVVLVPARWTVAAGAYAGAAVAIDAGRARGFWPLAPGPGGARRAVGWPDDAPRAVAFEGSGPPADTAAFWAAARALGQAWGRPLFRPAAPGEAGEVLVRVAPGLGALGLTTLGWTGAGGPGGGRVGGARVEFRTRAAGADARVVQHELLHALGFGHARAWPSVLSAPGGAWADRATAADVAYGHAFEGARRQARRAARELGAAYGLGAAP